MRRRRISMIVTATLAAGGLATLAVPHAVAATGPIDCPAALPTTQAVDGLTGTGYTVDRGTTPAPFTASVLGRLTDGVAPGVDMIIARLDSSAVRANGIWAGISGSPVYTADGKLIGSVSYSLTSASTPIAGLTPAEDLNAVYALNAKKTTKPAAHVKVSAAQARRLAATGAVSAKAASQGFNLIPVPLTVSGINGVKTTKLLKALGRKANATVRTGGNAASPGLADPSTISAGSNFAATFSYGDVTVGGVGTTTTVCNGRAVAFGHPLDSDGTVMDAAHNASAILIQSDPTFGSFKVANIGGVVGTLDKDTTTGIRAQLGVAPATYPITASLTADGGATVTGKTYGVNQFFAPEIADAQVISTLIKALHADAKGTAYLTFTVHGTRAGGVPFTATVSDHFSDTFALSESTYGYLSNIISAIQTQHYEPVTITGVDITGSVTETYRQWHVNNVRVWKRGAWAKGLSVSAKAGSKVKLRVSLSPYQQSSVTHKYLTVTVPKHTSGASGSLSVVGGSEGGFFDFGTASTPTGFDNVVKSVTTPVNDEVSATLDLSPAAKTVAVRSRQSAPVESYEKDYTVTVS